MDLMNMVVFDDELEEKDALELEKLNSIPHKEQERAKKLTVFFVSLVGAMIMAVIALFEYGIG